MTNNKPKAHHKTNPKNKTKPCKEYDTKRKCDDTKGKCEWKFTETNNEGIDLGECVNKTKKLHAPKKG